MQLMRARMTRGTAVVMCVTSRSVRRVSSHRRPAASAKRSGTCARPRPSRRSPAGSAPSRPPGTGTPSAAISLPPPSTASAFHRLAPRAHRQSLDAAHPGPGLNPPGAVAQRGQISRIHPVPGAAAASSSAFTPAGCAIPALSSCAGVSRLPGHNGRMDLGLRDRAYLVSGGSRGLGFAAAQALVAEGPMCCSALPTRPRPPPPRPASARMPRRAPPPPPGSPPITPIPPPTAS